ncbi:MAG: hypothetical protein BWY56_02412 [Acidobacteria bacterium ADurb.Bin340]|nr:MAG: hypothetical protein BWY56_02412 [Acidobacteria bacterium ADurb.Bin340]
MAPDLVLGGQIEIQVAAHMGTEEVVGPHAILVVQVAHGQGGAGVDAAADIHPLGVEGGGRRQDEGKGDQGAHRVLLSFKAGGHHGLGTLRRFRPESVKQAMTFLIKKRAPIGARFGFPVRFNRSSSPA